MKVKNFIKKHKKGIALCAITFSGVASYMLLKKFKGGGGGVQNKSFNGYAVGGNIFHPENGFFLTFYNEDSFGNETDTIGIKLTKEQVIGLHNMLKSYIPDRDRLSLLQTELDCLLNHAPCVDDCSDLENKMYSDMANLKETLEDFTTWGC